MKTKTLIFFQKHQFENICTLFSLQNYLQWPKDGNDLTFHCWMNRQIVVYIECYSDIKRNEILLFCDNMDKPRRPYAK